MVYCLFNSYFTFITKKKIDFSLISNFHCCLVKKGLAMKVVYQFAIRDDSHVKIVWLHVADLCKHDNLRF